jgi:hypothetical protein
VAGALPRLGLTLAAGLAAAGCLLTDDPEVRPVVPPAPNNVPRIVESSVSPPGWAVVVPDPLGDPACRVQLSIGTVVDEDIADSLSARWFVDYDPKDPPDTSFLGGEPLNLTGAAERPGPSLDSETNTRLKTKLASAPRVHMVMVVVSDGFDPKASDYTKVLEGRGSVSWTWAVEACP